MSRDQQKTCFYYYKILNQQLSLNLTLLKSGKVDQKVDQGVSVDQGIRAVDHAIDRNSAFGVSVDQGLRAVDLGVPIEQGLH